MVKSLLHFGYKPDLAVINSSVRESSPDSIEVNSDSGCQNYFGFAFLLPFYSGCATSISFSLTVKNAKYFRVELDGFTSRMQKAYVEFEDSGQITILGEEVQSCIVDVIEDGKLNVSLVFVPYRTRLAHFYIYAKNNLVGIDKTNLNFICSPLCLEYEMLPENNQEDICRRITDFGTMISVNGLFQFKNYLQVDFELHRPGLALAGLKLIGPAPYETIQWWANVKPKLLMSYENFGTDYLVPREPSIPLPSPTSMTFLGLDFAFSGHRINALNADLLDQRSSSYLDSDRIVYQLKFEVLFEDGSTEIIPLVHQESDFSSQLAKEFKFVDDYAIKNDVANRKLFLEVGARGMRSEGVRKRVESQFKYIGLDASSGLNVDLVGDAHNLSDVLDTQSIDVVYSDDVIEHLINPFAFVMQANKVLKINGLFIAKVPTTWPLHAEPCDFWRFSSHAWKGLLNNDTGFEVLHLREIGDSSVVPSILFDNVSANTQYAPAPLFTVVVAKKIANPENFKFGLCEDLGNYGHWSLQSKPTE